jgi:hypothetical protein
MAQSTVPINMILVRGSLLTPPTESYLLNFETIFDCAGAEFQLETLVYFVRLRTALGFSSDVTEAFRVFAATLTGNADSGLGDFVVRWWPCCKA